MSNIAQVLADTVTENRQLRQQIEYLNEVITDLKIDNKKIKAAFTVFKRDVKGE